MLWSESQAGEKAHIMGFQGTLKPQNQHSTVSNSSVIPLHTEVERGHEVKRSAGSAVCIE